MYFSLLFSFLRQKHFAYSQVWCALKNVTGQLLGWGMTNQSIFHHYKTSFKKSINLRHIFTLGLYGPKGYCHRWGRLSVCPSVCLSVCLSVRLRLSVRLSVTLYCEHDISSPNAPRLTKFVGDMHLQRGKVPIENQFRRPSWIQDGRHFVCLWYSFVNTISRHEMHLGLPNLLEICTYKSYRFLLKISYMAAILDFKMATTEKL